MRELFVNKKLLKGEQGFTLIELLVVIAIIGILAAIVLIGINPAARINEANQSQAQATLRQAAQIVESCVTKELAGANAATAYGTSGTACGNPVYLTGAGSYARNFPSQVGTTTGGAAAGPLCLSITAGSSVYYYSTTLGQSSNGKPAGCP